jgi:hypothetical protein
MAERVEDRAPSEVKASALVWRIVRLVDLNGQCRLKKNVIRRADTEFATL